MEGAGLRIPTRRSLYLQGVGYNLLLAETYDRLYFRQDTPAIVSKVSQAAKIRAISSNSTAKSAMQLAAALIHAFAFARFMKWRRTGPMSYRKGYAPVEARLWLNLTMMLRFRCGAQIDWLRAHTGWEGR